MDEVWALIPGFPDYEVSNYGRVRNIRFESFLRPSMSNSRTLKVGLVRDRIQTTRSLKHIVAEIFVEGKDAIFDTPIQLNGEVTDVCAWNLLWRPRWFAVRYSRQFTMAPKNAFAGPIRDVDTRQRFERAIDAAIYTGLLVEDIWRSIWYQHPVFPTKQRFEAC